MTVISYTLFFKYFLMGGKKCPKCGKKGLFFGIIGKEWLGIRCMYCGYEERIQKRGKLLTGLLRLLRSLRARGPFFLLSEALSEMLKTLKSRIVKWLNQR